MLKRSSALWASLTLLLVTALTVSCGSGEEIAGSGPDSEGSTEATARSVQALPKGTAGAVNGADDFCNNAANKCTLGEGDCDSNSQCATGLLCVNNMGPKWDLAVATDACAPAHCRNDVQDGGETRIDCGGPECGKCIDVCDGTDGTLGAQGYCNGVTCVCSVGQGDCARDADCLGGLRCARMARQYGLTSDVCVPIHCQDGVLQRSLGELDIDCGGECGNCMPNCSGRPGVDPFCDYCRCQAGHGDCEHDVDCQRGLKCVGNIGSKFALPYLIDVCQPHHCDNGVLDAANGETFVDCGGPCGACGVTDFDAGTRHACDITSGRVRCWGSNAAWQLGEPTATVAQRSSPTPVPGLPAAAHTLVAAGGSHSCALAGAVLSCWGANNAGQLGNGLPSAWSTPVTVTAPPGTVQQIAAGENHSCIRLNGAVHCWGDNSAGQLGNGTTSGSQATPMPVVGITDSIFISAGFNHTCAVRAGGTVLCWGANNSTKLGAGTVNVASGTPLQVTGVTGAVQVSAGDAHSCALLSSGATMCWGNNTANALWIGGASADNRAAATVTGSAAGVSIASSSNAVCVALSSAGGFARCWGYGSFGQTGNGSTPDPALPSAPTLVGGATRVPLVRGGGSFMCGNTTVAPGVLRCWGDDHDGQLGKASALMLNTPQVVWPPPSASTAVDAGDASTCAISGGQVYCWGKNEDGQIGDGTLLQRRMPVLVPSLSGATSVAVGDRHACAVVSGTMRCWGHNLFGQLGNASTTSSATPVTVGGLSSAPIQVDAGNLTTCALLTGGSIACWGRGSEGELGNGSITGTNTPVAVTGISSATAIAAGMRHVCAIVDDSVLGRVVRCWGYNSSGQLGDGTLTNRTTFVTVPGLTDVVSLAAGQAHTCVVLASGEARCWGRNDYGQLGLATSVQSSPTPVAVPGITNARSISTWGSFTCALLRSGETRCWGQNTRGQLGIGSTAELDPTPTALPGIWTAIAAGGRHVCGILTSGQVRCWGYNDYGQTGTGKAFYFPEAATAVPAPVPSVPGTQCVSNADCSFGQVCWAQQGPRFDLPQGSSVCVNAECMTTPTPSCGAASDKCGHCENVPRACNGTQGSCYFGESCGTENGGYFDNSPELRKCWTAGCDDPDFRASNCGSLEAACGNCECTRNCPEKQCGDDPADGCGGACTGFCPPGGVGCHSDADCAAGTTCSGRTPGSATPNVCVPPLVASADCVTVENAVTRTARFSYQSSRSGPVSVPHGPTNQVTPAPASGFEPPTQFLPGTHPYWVPFQGDQVSWQLEGSLATATLALRRCAVDDYPPSAGGGAPIIDSVSVSAPNSGVLPDIIPDRPPVTTFAFSNSPASLVLQPFPSPVPFGVRVTQITVGEEGGFAEVDADVYVTVNGETHMHDVLTVDGATITGPLDVDALYTFAPTISTSVPVNIQLIERDNWPGSDDTEINLDFTVDPTTGVSTHIGSPRPNCTLTGNGWGLCWEFTPTLAPPIAQDFQPAICASFSANFFDSGFGEDHLAGRQTHAAPAAFAQAELTATFAPAPIWRGFLDLNGCVPMLRADTAGIRASALARPLTAPDARVRLTFKSTFCRPADGSTFDVPPVDDADCVAKGGISWRVQEVSAGFSAFVGASGQLELGQTNVALKTFAPSTFSGVLDPATGIVSNGWLHPATATLVADQSGAAQASRLDDVSRMAAISGQILRTDDAGIAAGIYNVFANDSCPDRSPAVRGDACVSTEGLFMGPGKLGFFNPDFLQTKWKFVATHEAGHLIQGRVVGSIKASDYDFAPLVPGDPLGCSPANQVVLAIDTQTGPSTRTSCADPPGTDALCRCDHVDVANKLHCLQSLERPGGAQLEGYAQFYSSKIWNLRNDPGCTFVYYKEFLDEICRSAECTAFAPALPSWFSSLQRAMPPVPIDCSGPLLWRNTRCGVAAFGTELDWMAFFWTLHRGAGGGTPFTISDINRVYRRSCGTMAVPEDICRGDRDRSWADLVAAAGQVFGMGSPQAVAYLNAGNSTGVSMSVP